MQSDSQQQTDLPRLPTRVPGLDAVLRGGLLVGDTYLITGEPGTGKTTLANHLAFAHAAAGGNVLFATLLTESHDRMLNHLQGLSFFDRALVGERIQYVSLLSAFKEGDLEATLRLIVNTMRDHEVSLLVIDGAGAAPHFGGSDVEYLEFVHGLSTRASVHGCTSVLLADIRDAEMIATHVDGIVQLSNESMAARDARWLRVEKLRGSDYLNGRHRFAIGEDGIAVFPRLEAIHAEGEPAWHDPETRLGFGVSGLDTMMAGGLSEASSTLVLGTPGAGKTLLGLHFLAEGARRGEPGMIATFHEPAPALVSTADRAGMDLGRHLDSRMVRVMWRSPLELAPDEWAQQLLVEVAEHRPRRLVIDAFSDLTPLFAIPERCNFFTPALAIALRNHGVTSLINLEVDTYASPQLTVPIQNLSASVDTTILLRVIELRSSLHRMVSVLKQRQTGFDPTIRGFTIGSDGITVGDPFDATALLTGTAAPPPHLS